MSSKTKPNHLKYPLKVNHILYIGEQLLNHFVEELKYNK